MNLAATYYPIFYGHYGPISEEGRVTLFGIFIILNFAFIITLAITTLIYLRADKEKKRDWLGDNYWGFLWYDMPMFASMILLFGVAIDGVVLLCLLGEKVGNAIL